MSAFEGSLGRDLRCAGARSALFLALSLTVVTLASSGKASPQVLSTTVLFGLLPMPLSLLEFRRARRPVGQRALLLLLIWLTASLLLLALAFQVTYVSEGGLEGLGTVYELLSNIADAPILLLIFPVGALPFVFVAWPRVPETASPVRSVAKVVGLLFIPFLITAACVPAFGVGILLIMLAMLYSAGDWLEVKLWTAAHRTEVDALQQRRGVGDLPYGKLWLLAYLNYAPARATMGSDAPVPSAELQTWLKDLELAGSQAILRAALAVAQLTAPLLDEHSQGETPGRGLSLALASCVEAPSSEARAAATAALDRCPQSGWEHDVLKASTTAITTEGPWASITAARELTYAAEQVAEHIGEAPTREAISSILVTWALEETPKDA